MYQGVLFVVSIDIYIYIYIFKYILVQHFSQPDQSLSWWIPWRGRAISPSSFRSAGDLSQTGLTGVRLAEVSRLRVDGLIGKQMKVCPD